MKKFKNLDDSLQQLKEYLPNIEDTSNAIIFGISDNKGYLSSCLAHKIHLYWKIKFDFLFVKKIYSPINTNLTIAMISETGHISTNDDLISYFDIEKDYLHNEAKREYDKISGLTHMLKENDLEQNVKGKDVYLVDYAVCSGLKMICAINSVADKGAKSIYVISPVMPAHIYDKIYAMVDNIFYVHKIKHFVSKKFYYKKLEDTSIQEIAHLEDKKLQGHL